jgi:hypothetical protein
MEGVWREKNGTEKKLVAKKKGEKGMNERDQGLFDILLLYNCAIFRLLAELPPFKCLYIFTFFHFIKASTELPDFSLRLRTFFPGLSETFFSLTPAMGLQSRRRRLNHSRHHRESTNYAPWQLSETSRFEIHFAGALFAWLFFLEGQCLLGKKLFSFAWRRFCENLQRNEEGNDNFKTIYR